MKPGSTRRPAATRSDEYQPLIDRWAAAAGRLPDERAVSINALDRVRRRRLAWREVGQGRPVVLLHGLFSDAHVNWIKFGHAAKLAARGLPGDHARPSRPRPARQPHDPAHYPPGILGRDLASSSRISASTTIDLGGFSLGSRTAVRRSGRDAAAPGDPCRAWGSKGSPAGSARKQFFVDAIDQFRQRASRGDPHWMAIQFMKTMKVDRIAAALLLPTVSSDAATEWLAAFTMPTLVLCGTEDQDNGSAAELAAALPNATLREVPGTHMSSRHQARVRRRDRRLSRA